MKYYLSSFEIGQEGKKLTSLCPHGKIGYIPNARDFISINLERRENRNKKDMSLLNDLGLMVALIDLRDYFGRQDALRKKLKELGAIFISGGNVFILRQAMKLSGLDIILKELQNDVNFLYAGYSAGGCVLAQSLKGMDIVDSLDTPYDEQKEIIWEGLEFVDFRFIPHWHSDHPESEDIEKEVEYCKQNNIPYRTLKDGEVLIIE